MRLRCSVIDADAPTDERALCKKFASRGPFTDGRAGQLLRAASEKRLAGARDDRESRPRELCQAIANSACAELASDLDAKSPKAERACPSVPAAAPPAASLGLREVEATTKVKSKDYVGRDCQD